MIRKIEIKTRIEKNMLKKNRNDGDVERKRRFVDDEDGEIAKFDDTAITFVERGEDGESVVK